MLFSVSSAGSFSEAGVGQSLAKPVPVCERVKLNVDIPSTFESKGFLCVYMRACGRGVHQSHSVLCHLDLQLARSTI